MLNRICFLFPALLAGTACAKLPASVPVSTGSAFVTPQPNGDLNVSLIETDDLRGQVAGAFAYAAGREVGSGVARAFSGLLPGRTVTDLPTGTATYSATFEGSMIDNITIEDNFLEGSIRGFSGTIPLIARFEAGTLKGYGDSLRVNGNINDQTISGTVIYNDVIGDLSGVIGGDRVIGVFHGASDEMVYAGGFVGPIAP